MKVAIIHEWLVIVGGAEKVLKAMLDVFPDADVYTLVAKKEICDELGLKWNKVHTSFIQKMPLGIKRYRFYLPLFPFAVEQFDLRGYDLIISSSHAVAKGVLTKAGQLHICYCHSPIRYVWDMYHEYLEISHLSKGLKGWITRYLLHRVRIWDALSSQRPDYYISNSNYVGRRIRETYRRESVTIYPNVDVSKFELCEVKEDFYLTSSRLVGYKRIDLIVEAFNDMPDKKLVVIGGGPNLESIRQQAASNISVMGYQPFDVLKHYLQKAKAFVFAAEEDFGIVPIEAQACGTPVIAYGRGGSLETVVNNVTGLFFMEQTADAIIKAVEDFEMKCIHFNPVEIRLHTEKFSETCFKTHFKEFIDTKSVSYTHLTLPTIA